MHVASAQSSELEKSLQIEIEGDLYFDAFTRGIYSTDASLYRVPPLGVVVPKSVQDVVKTHQIAARFHVAITPRGSGTSLSGQSIGPGLILDFSKYLNRIVEIDAQNKMARVEPGVVLDKFNAVLAPHKLQFGPDVATSSRANLGGMIGNNSAGSRSIWQGKTVDHVISLDVVLDDGTQVTLSPQDAAALQAMQTRSDRASKLHTEVARVIAANRDEILRKFPPIERRVSGYNLDEFVPESRTRRPTPPVVAEVREREAQRMPGADFNLAKLVVGAEGSLGTIVGATVHLVDLPAARGLVVLHFDSLAHAVDSIGPVLECSPSAAELFDAMILRLAEQSLEYRNYLDFVVGRPESLMIVEFSAATMDEVRERAQQMIARLQGTTGLQHVLEAFEPRLVAHVWACRKAALPLLMGIPGNRKPIAFVEDTAVDPHKLPEFVDRFRKILIKQGTDGAFYGHASVGCLHIRPLIDSASRDDLQRMRVILDEVSDLVLEFGGAMSGEHGDGMVRSFLNEKLFGSQIYRAFKEVKAAFDPTNRMNPGKVVDGPSPVENLRFGAEYQTLPIVTTLDFSRQGGFAKAVELCNGSGICRKTQTGTMCPSFMATGDEEHGTRGRANALRLALSGTLPAEELTGERMFETMSLCLQCKGCKAECPSNVDVAKMKMEFLSQYQARHGVSLGTRLMGHAHRLNRWGSALAPLSNWLANLPGAGLLTEKLLGVDRRRPLPTFEHNHFRKWFSSRTHGTVSSSTKATRGPIVLLDDCLTSYCEPAVNRAAVQVLEAAGYEVHLAGLTCCGRTLASKGFLKEAQSLARENIALLKPWTERGVPIVASEPSCVSMLIDDYLDLVPGADAEQVAKSTAQVDMFISQAGLELPLIERKQPVVLHGHCHQRALVGAKGTEQALEKVPGTSVKLLDSGCCGMAGSFGYEHYDVSMTIGERVLFPAVRAAADACIVAPGFSCRHQIAHGTGRKALHPIEFLAEQLQKGGME